MQDTTNDARTASPASAAPLAVPNATTTTESQSQPGFWDWTATDFLNSGVQVATSWPLAMLIALFILRRQVKLLTERMLKWSGFGVDIEFGAGLEKAEILAVDARPPETPTAQIAMAEEKAENNVALQEILKPPQTLGSDERMRRLLELSPKAVVLEAFTSLEDRAQCRHSTFN